LLLSNNPFLGESGKERGGREERDEREEEKRREDRG
jgi:hypothetical protein